MKVRFMTLVAARKAGHRRMQSKLDASPISVMECPLQEGRRDLLREYSGKIYRPFENAMCIFTIPGNLYCKGMLHRHGSEKTV
jgi:hypothetical protein